MKKFIVLASVLMSLQTISAQVTIQDSYESSRLRVGGGLGLGFGNNGYFGINVSPSVGYMLTNSLETGVSIGYQYSTNDYVKSNLFSGGPYANYYISDAFFARSQFEYFKGNLKIKQSSIENDINESALWIGGGYRSTGKISFQTGLMYNVLYDENDSSIFNSAVRPFAGISIGI